MRNSGCVSGLVTLRGCHFRNPRGSLFGLALVRLSDPSCKVVWEDVEVEDFKIDLAGVQGYFFLTPKKHR